MIAAIITGLLIFSAYPDPLQAENGGEAVQLHNPTDTPITTDGLVLATKSASYQLPPATVLPGAGYLIADTSWSGSEGLRDNHSWPDADFEASLSLANTDGFVELRRTQENGTHQVLSSLAWNSSIGKAREGYAWTPSGEAQPLFWNRSMELVPFTITLEETVAPPSITNVTIPDDTPQPGVQLLGYARNLTVTATITSDVQAVTAALGGRETELEREGNTTTYRGTITIPALPSGEEELLITASGEGGEREERVRVTILPTASIAIERTVLRGVRGGASEGPLVITNLGNSRRAIKIATLPAGVSCEPESATIAPGGNVTFTCTAAPGRAWNESTGYALAHELAAYVEE